jgi:hypothetical protein
MEVPKVLRWRQSAPCWESALSSCKIKTESASHPWGIEARTVILRPSQMKYEIRWNPALEEWFCAICGRVSDHLVHEDAKGEMELFKCEPPFQPSKPNSKN